MFGRSRAGLSRRSGPSAGPKKQASSIQHHFFPSPTKGWVTAVNLAISPPDSAQVLENFYPTTTGISMRRGCLKFGTGSSAGDPVESLMSYVGDATSKMFATSGGKIINMTSPSDAHVEPAADVSGQTSDYYAHVNFATPGGNYMSVVNGTDSLQLYDGASWAAITGTSVPAITGVATSALSHVNVYRNRQWFVEDGTLNAHYLPTGSIAGALSTVSLSSIFSQGGTLVFTATWSFDSGEGLNDVIVFASSEGGYAVYKGDPAAADWSIVGVYDAPAPLGKNAFLKFGGDLLILTEVGLVPMSAIIKKDPAALALASPSRSIQPDWTAEARARSNVPWEIVKWTSRNIAYVTCPVTSDESVTPPICFAVNLQTGAWSKVTGWNTRCFALHDGEVYFGTGTGTVMQADVTGSDDGQMIYYTYVGSSDHLKAVDRTKTVHQVRAVFRSRHAFNPAISISTDYEVNLPPFPDAAAINSTPDEWDVGKWDQAKWDVASSQTTINTGWVSVGRTGFAHAPQIQITSGSAAAPAAELVLIEAMYEMGGRVV